MDVVGRLGLDADMAGIAEDIASLERVATVAVYVALIVGTVLFQGATSRYYFSKARRLNDFVWETPPWIVEMQRRGGGL